MSAGSVGRTTAPGRPEPVPPAPVRPLASARAVQAAPVPSNAVYLRRAPSAREDPGAAPRSGTPARPVSAEPVVSPAVPVRSSAGPGNRQPGQSGSYGRRSVSPGLPVDRRHAGPRPGTGPAAASFPVSRQAPQLASGPAPAVARGGASVGRGAHPFRGVTEVFPALPVHRAATAPAAAGGIAPAPLPVPVPVPVPAPAAAGGAAPAAAALPVQRTPGTPRPPALVQPPRPAPPQSSPVTVHSGGTAAGGGDAPPPPYSAHAESPPPYAPPGRPVSPNLNNGPRCDGSTDDTGSRFDARELSDGQLDELTHRLIGPITRLLRTELRMDRERIGRLRDPRR